MQLSPFTHYYAHKLLRDHINSLNCLRLEATTSQSHHQVDLNQTLLRLYPESAERASKIQELEFLTHFCQEIEQDKYQQDSVDQIRQQILQLLGFYLSSVIPKESPTILPEELAHRFCFYQAHSVRECLRHEHEFYGLAHSFRQTDRLRAYQFAWALAKQGIPMILTVSAERYVIWVRLRSPAYALLSKQSHWLLKMVLPLYSILSKFKQVTAYNLPHSTTINFATTEILEAS
jgi:hypothetical protein